MSSRLRAFLALFMPIAMYTRSAPAVMTIAMTITKRASARSFTGPVGAFSAYAVENRYGAARIEIIKALKRHIAFTLM